MKFWLIVVAVVAMGSFSIALLSYTGLPYSPLSSLGGGNLYVPTPRVERYVVTLSSVQVNKDKTGAGSPWVTIVQGPVTFDLADLARGGLPPFLGDNLAEPGTYRIIRMNMDKVELGLAGEEDLLPAKITKPFIQLVETFEVVAGRTTRLLLDFDGTRSLVETPPGSRKFNFKPEVRLVVLPGSPSASGPTSEPLGGHSVPFYRIASRIASASEAGTIQILVGDTAAAPVFTLTGQVLLQGRGEADHADTMLTLFKDGAPVAPVLITPSDGSFFFALGAGNYRLQARHAGWLAQDRELFLDADRALPPIKLLAGDADHNERIDFRDLRKCQQGLDQPSSPCKFTDAEGARTTILDVAYAGMNFGQPARVGVGTPIIDGVMSPGEWDSARKTEFVVTLPPGEGGGMTSAALFVMNDAANLYLAVQIVRSTLGSSSVAFEFDNDHDGVAENGDDILLINPSVLPQFHDEVRTNEPPCPSGSAPAQCGLFDTQVGGTNDGQGTATNNGVFSFYEFSHPLNSADNLHDFSLAQGDTVGFFLMVRFCGGDCVDTYVPGPGFRHYRDIVVLLVH